MISPVRVSAFRFERSALFVALLISACAENQVIIDGGPQPSIRPENNLCAEDSECRDGFVCSGHIFDPVTSEPVERRCMELCSGPPLDAYCPGGELCLASFGPGMESRQVCWIGRDDVPRCPLRALNPRCPRGMACTEDPQDETTLLGHCRPLCDSLAECGPGEVCARLFVGSRHDRACRSGCTRDSDCSAWENPAIVCVRHACDNYELNCDADSEPECTVPAQCEYGPTLPATCEVDSRECRNGGNARCAAQGMLCALDGQCFTPSR